MSPAYLAAGNYLEQLAFVRQDLDSVIPMLYRGAVLEFGR